MDDRNTDRLLEQGFAGDPPGQVFRAKVLLDSTAALAHRQRTVHMWPPAVRSAAAVLIAAVSFLVGRGSMGPLSPPQSAQPVVAGAGEPLAVPDELITWLQAAQLFRQLGMQDRMARAVERAGRLLPADMVVAEGRTQRVFATAGAIEDREDRAEPMGMPGPNPSVRSVNQILAQTFGD